MAKNPFYLNLIAEALKRKPNSKIPTHRAKLIESFVLGSIERKHREGVLPSRHFKDDMIAVVLPRVAKWSLRMLITEVNTMSVPFHLSIEFQDIQSPSDSLKTLEIAENYGLLRFSGLLEESRERWGYPAFLHDNFRDFFAAMYLLSLRRSILRKLLPKIIEYFAWDQPLLFFLELTNNEQICKEVTELALSEDPVLGGMCARHAHSLQKELCVKAACEVYKLLKSFFRTNFLSNITRADKILEMRSSPKYALGQLSVSDLLSIWQDQSDGSEIEHHIFEAIRENVSVGDFEYLKEIWSTLPKTPRGEVHSILTCIARIPTHDAFQFFVEAYKDLFTSPDFELNELTEWLFNYFMVDYIEYSPSLLQAIAVFPPDKYPNELGMLLSKVRKITKKEVRLLEQFVFHDNDNIADSACKLLAKTSSTASFPILISRLESVNKKLFPILIYESSQLELCQLRNTLLQEIVHIDPQESSKFIIGQISQIESQNRSLFHPWTSTVPKFYWPFISALSETRSQEALNLLVERACQAFDPDLSTYCANLLEGWPERDMVLAAIKDYSQNGKYSRYAKLLRARFKGTKCSVDILKLFDDLFSQTVLKEKSLPISDPSCRLVYYEKQQGTTEYSLAEALHLLLMAVRAVSMTPSPEITEKVLHILKWQYEHVVGIARKIGNGPMVMSLDLLAESLSTFTSLILRGASRPILERFLRSDTLGHLLDLITKEWHGSFDECCSNLTRSLVRFCESVPNEYVPELFSILCNKYKQVSNQLFSAKFDIPAERICQVIVTLCRRVDDDLALGFINDIEPPSPQIDQKHLHIVPEFVKAIKLAKGRRFLLDSKE
jgi:hypothetical protein